MREIRGAGQGWGPASCLIPPATGDARRQSAPTNYQTYKTVRRTHVAPRPSLPLAPFSPSTLTLSEHQEHHWPPIHHRSSLTVAECAGASGCCAGGPSTFSVEPAILGPSWKCPPAAPSSSAPRFRATRQMWLPCLLSRASCCPLLGCANLPLRPKSRNDKGPPAGLSFGYQLCPVYLSFFCHVFLFFFKI